MLRNLRSLTAVVFICFLVLVFSSLALPAQDHVVPTPNLHQAIVNSASRRQTNINKVENFLSSKPVQKVAEKSGLNLKQVEQAVPTLNDQDLAQLAQRTDHIQNNFAAGALTTEQLTIIIAAAIVVIVILAIKA
ncbi:MAG TPA: PA2779 family protein [Terriglobia bacterium]|nr:PA2779 family protein [Terriglobia bacterium]